MHMLGLVLCCRIYVSVEALDLSGGFILNLAMQKFENAKGVVTDAARASQ